eukprot:129197-Chlamydomonas_euryale.AAC.1
MLHAPLPEKKREKGGGQRAGSLKQQRSNGSSIPEPAPRDDSHSQDLARSLGPGSSSCVLAG